MANSEDEDAYLYGSDDDAPAAKKQKLEKSASTEATGDNLTAPDETTNNDNDDDDDDDDDDDSSDDDVEFVIGDLGPKISNAATTTASADTKEGSAEAEKKPKDDANVASIDVNKVADYEGKPLTQLDLDELKDKPWRAPGADVSDYFNYGFDEFTWTAYCHKQDKLRGEFNPQKVLAKMMGGGGKKGMPFFPMPMPPNMANMPMPPLPPNKGGMPPSMPKGGPKGQMPTGPKRRR